ncbi:hypothetical protein QA597_09985 [Marinilabiliaceae bacterium ANBcel2]|nr:hypothetical protein [Marinilabiliaceae bacterium ANBcel2]
MKTKLLTMLLMLISITITASQNEESQKRQIERIKSQKVAFFTDKIELTSSEAQKFWPLYNEYSNQKDSLFHLRIKTRRELSRNYKEMSEAEKLEAMDLKNQLHLQEVKLDIKYHEQFKKVLSTNQIVRLYQAEHEFRMRLFDQIRKIRQKKTP